MAICANAEQHEVVAATLPCSTASTTLRARSRCRACRDHPEHPALRAEWEAELAEMRDTMLSIRQQLAEELRRQCNTDRFDHRVPQGMFAPLTG